MAIGIDDLVVAGLSIIIGAAIEARQERNAKDRQMAETKITNLFNGLRDRFGVTYDQLNQLANKLDLRLGNLKEIASGSARLSRASELLRNYVVRYPQKQEAINKAKNEISKLQANIGMTSGEYSSKIQKSTAGGNYSVSAAKDALNYAKQGNEIVDAVNAEFKENDNIPKIEESKDMDLQLNRKES